MDGKYRLVFLSRVDLLRNSSSTSVGLYFAMDASPILSNPLIIGGARHLIQQSRLPPLASHLFQQPKVGSILHEKTVVHQLLLFSFSSIWIPTPDTPRCARSDAAAISFCGNLRASSRATTFRRRPAYFFQIEARAMIQPHIFLLVGKEALLLNSGKKSSGTTGPIRIE
eukprot:IDg10299t1